jgi:hypothetical protein|tara:strand:- start:65 stop:460 length:396 start_codon:yes stop_codon:yes gene_type:complete
MKIRKGELKSYVKQALLELDEPPFRTGLNKADWQGIGDPRGSGADTDVFPETEAEKLGDQIAAAMEGGIRNALMNSLGEEKGLMIYDKYLADVDDEILNIAMRMRDAALDLTGEPEGVTGEEEDLDLQEEW